MPRAKWMSLRIERDVPLAPFTTLELGGRAQHFAEVQSRAELLEGLAWARERGLPVSVIAGGSNVLISDRGIAGLVLRMRTRGVEFAAERVSVEAGENWDELVAACVQRELCGLECLSGIPGSVGATPIQNVGAYGQEVASSITRVDVLDRQTLQSAWWEPAACGFGYRSSRFKREPGRFIVLAVEFGLRAGVPDPPRYPELARALAADASVGAVRRCVLALRRAKSMLLEADDDNRRSAGSFFLNPVLSAAQADEVERRASALGASELPRYLQADGTMKLSAAWLIEHSGTHKAERLGHVGVSSKHTLSLVHHGDGSSSELLALAELVRERVQNVFGVQLTAEPVLMGFDDPRF
jgi:UDP-N-acetylmuramate dehydrogenase